MKNVFPVLSHAYLVDRGRCQIILERSIKFLLAISLPLMSGICVAARPLIRLLYGSGFAPSVPVLRVMACCIPLAFLFELLWRLLAARDQQYLMLRAQIIIAFLRLTGGYLLITRLASLGAALSASVFLAGHVLLLGLYARRDGTRLRIYHVIWRLSLAATGMAAVTAVFIERWQLWLAALLAGMLYVAMVFVLKALSPADLAVLRKIGQVRTAV
jgi:O-antigen/teichoic acid export membrane protein